MDNNCPNCNRISEDELGCEHGAWHFESYPECLICGEPAKFETVSFGWDSKYDMGYICDKCCRLYIEPAVEKALQEKQNGQKD